MRSIIFIATLIFVPVLLLAEESDTTKNYNLNPVTVTATQTEIPRNLVAPSISVVTAEDIKANSDKSIFTLLSQSVPGVFVTERDVLGFGVNTPSGQITIRGIGGSPNNQVLMLIDGRPQYMGWYGHPINDSYLAANVDRVEIIRGPASMLYGSNAMGGVINIITHGTQQDGVSGDASVSYGSNDAQRYGMHLGYQKDKWNILGSFTHEHTDGARDWSEYTANSGYLKSSYQLNTQYRFSIDGSYTQFNTYDPGQIDAPHVDDWIHVQRGYVGAGLENDFGYSKGGIRFAYNAGHHEFSPSYGNASWVSDDHLAAVNLFQSFSLFSDNTITAGIDVQQNGGAGSNTNGGDFGNHSIEDYAGYVSIQQLLFNRLLANAGVRFVHNSYFGDLAVPQAGITYKLAEETNVRASAARGYRAPQIFELYQLTSLSGTLQPEKLWNYEIGFSHMFAQVASIDVAGFIIDADNTIYDAWYMKKALNTGGFHRSGVECAVQLLPVDNLKLSASYSYNDKPDVAQSVPKHKMYLGGEYHWQQFTVSVGAQYVNTLYGWDTGFFTLKKLSDYTNADAHIAVQVLEKVSVSVSSQNLLNESYQTIYGYPMPGRTFTIGVQAGI
jgi:outer membrane cobalamin receptor